MSKYMKLTLGLVTVVFLSLSLSSDSLGSEFAGGTLGESMSSPEKSKKARKKVEKPEEKRSNQLGLDSEIKDSQKLEKAKSAVLDKKEDASDDELEDILN